MGEHKAQSPQADLLFKAILSLKTTEECYDMAQRVETASMLLKGRTYEQIVKDVEISTATISRINRCIQYGNGGYASILNRIHAGEE